MKTTVKLSLASVLAFAVALPVSAKTASKPVKAPAATAGNGGP